MRYLSTGFSSARATGSLAERGRFLWLAFPKLSILFPILGIFDTIDKPQEAVMDYQQYFMRDPKICGGEPVIKSSE